MAEYVITPNYSYGIENAQVQLVRTKDDCILYSLPLQQDNFTFLAGYAKGMNINAVIL